MIKINDIYDIIITNEPYYTHPQLNNIKEQYIKQSQYIKFLHHNEYNKLFHLPNKKIVVSSHTGDYTHDQHSKIDNFLIDNSNIIFYSTNLNIPKKNNTHALPFGIMSQQAEFIGKMDHGIIKTNFVYSNFNLHTWYERRKVFNIIGTKRFITQTNYPPSMGVEGFYRYCNDLITYKFAITPRGNGLDTYRFWECLYLGVIPIVIKSYLTSYFTNKLPIVEVSSYDILTEEFLYEQYNIISQKKYNMNRLNRWFWIDEIYKQLLKIEEENI